MAALIHLGVEPFLIATSLVGVVAQQLVRKVCPNCRCRVDIGITPKDLDAVYREEFLRVHVPDKPLSFSYGEGCDECFRTGYRDRTGVFEILRVTQAIRRMILAKATAEAIEETAVSEGMVRMRTLGVRRSSGSCQWPMSTSDTKRWRLPEWGARLDGGLVRTAGFQACHLCLVMGGWIDPPRWRAWKPAVRLEAHHPSDPRPPC